MFGRKSKRGLRSKPKKKKKMKLVLSSNYYCKVLGQPGAHLPRTSSGDGARPSGRGH